MSLTDALTTGKQTLPDTRQTRLAPCEHLADFLQKHRCAFSFVDTALRTRKSFLRNRTGGDENYRHMPVMSFHCLRNDSAVHVRHRKVEENEVHLIAGKERAMPRSA